MKFNLFITVCSAILFLASCKKDFSDLNTETFAHAGFSLNHSRTPFPPNTYELFQHTISNYDIEGVELDVQMTSDSVLVLFHDLSLDENSSLAGCINSKKWDEVQNAEIYNSNFYIQELKPSLELLINSGIRVILDVKHYNECIGQSIDFSAFNHSLNELMIDFSAVQKQNIIINSRSHWFLNTIDDPSIIKSIESDDPQYAFEYMKTAQVTMLAIKLKALNNVINDSLKFHGYSLAIYNVKTRAENKRALNFAPEIVISDDIINTINCLNE